MRATSIAAVSTTSCEVAPRCTCPRAASEATAAVSALTRGWAGLPPPAAAVPIASASKASACAAAAIASAASARDQAHLGLGAGQPRLEVEHRLQPGALADGLGHRSLREHAREEAVHARGSPA